MGSKKSQASCENKKILRNFQMKWWIALLLLMVCHSTIDATQVNLITMPKGGTHLLTKLFNLIAKEVGVEPNDLYTQCHTMSVPQEKLSSPLKVVLVRDPRDAMVSSVEWVDWHIEENMASHWFRTNWPGKTFKEKLHILLFPRIPEHLNAFEYINILKFFRDPNNFVVHFEDLVGEGGGGSREVQKATICDILSYIGYDLSDQSIDAIISQLWGSSATFRKGVIGRWKEHINDLDMQKWMNYRLGGIMQELGYIDSAEWL